MAETRGEARLFVLAGPDLARSFALGERTTLGRSDECDVVLSDRSISRKHAVLVRQGERWFVQDLGSTNGVSKAGQRAERFELADGEEFRLGDLPLRLRLDAAVAAQEIEFDLGPPVKGSAPSAAAPSPAAEKVSAPRAEPAPRLEEDEKADEIEIEEPDAPLPAATHTLAATTFRAARVERRSGFFAGEFAQQPFWLRTLVVLGLMVLGLGLAYGAFWAVQLLRAGL